MDLISVIVPVYNVEKYLDRCVESIVKQTYTNLEIILVDDGSPDSCPQICDEWAEKDDRIKVIHKQNGGLSDARNAGLAVATGEYIAFVDSDDWVDKKYIEYLHNAVIKYDVVIAACDIQLVYNENILDILINPSVDIYKTEQALKTLMNGEKFRAVAWNKLYHKSLLSGENFEIGRYHEDEFFTYRILAKASRLAFVNAGLYYYYQREGSIMNSVSYKHLDALDAYIERINYLKSSYPNLYVTDKIMFCVSCVNFYIESFDVSEEERKKIISRIKKCRKRVDFQLFELKKYSARDLIYIIGSGSCIGIMSRLLYVRRKATK